MAASPSIPALANASPSGTSYQRVGVGAVSAGGDVEGLGEQREEHEAGYEHQDYRGLALLGEIEAETAGLDSPAPDSRPDEDDEEHHGEYVQVGGEDSDAGVGEYGLREFGPDGVGEDVEDVAGGEGEESPEYEEVGEAGAVSERNALEHLSLSEDVGERAEETADRLVESFGVLAEQDEPEDAQVENVGGGGERADGQRVNG